jgi:Uma2 family endonuclease
MATATKPRARVLAPEERFMLYNVGWDGYETMLKLVGDRPVHLTYDRGDLELMSPSYDHDIYKRLLGRMIDTITEELKIPCLGAASTTWRKKAEDRGLEADDCYYLASRPRLRKRGKRTYVDLSAGPPPDLAIEIEISHSALDRMGIYAALGVPEVWRFDGETLRVEQLQADRTYATMSSSPSFSSLPLKEVVRWLQRGAKSKDHTEWARQFRDWVRAKLSPHHEGL